MGRDYIVYETLGNRELPGRRFPLLIEDCINRELALRTMRLEAAVCRILGEGAWTLRTNNTVPELAPVL